MLRHHFLAATVALSFATTALSQTTWTSFEDRKGHAIASTPFGGVMMFGGESVETSDKLLNDTQQLSSNNKKWTAAATLHLPLPRTEHALAAGLDGGSSDVFVMFGGLRRVAIDNPATTITDDTFVFVGGDWVKIDPPVGTSAPSPRTGHAMVTDLFRNKVVLFGGFSGGIPRNDLWEFDPATNEWTEVIPSFQPGSPQQRFDHSMAFDSLRGVIYLFGGSPFQNDTWQYDPSTQTWTDISQPTRPSGRRKAAISYLPTFDQVVLFGGQDNTLTSLTDTWTMNPATGAWTQQAPTTTPPGRFEHAMSPDQLGTKAVLLGGTDGSDEALESTWLWDGTDWNEEIPPPSPRTGVAMTYDSARGKHVLFGGRSAPGSTDLGDTWELEELTWEHKTPSPAPTARADAGLCYDEARNVTVLFGGRQSGSCGTPLGDTWEWDGTTWTPKSPANSPPASGGMQPVFDTKRNLVWVLVGTEMWSYDGTDWLHARIPEGRGQFAHCFDSVRQRVVVAGGEKPSLTLTSEVWEWNGSGWSQEESLPLDRTDVRMAFDPVRGESVICGGRRGPAAAAVRLAETLAWDGSAWTPLSPLSTGKSGIGVVFDPLRGFIVAVGGYTNTNTISDAVEELTGPSWTNFAGIRPTGRADGAIAFHTASGNIVRFGGICGTPNVSCADTWTFNGTSWSEHFPATPPPARQGTAMAYHPDSQRLVMFGGYNQYAATPLLGDTWTWDGTDWHLEGGGAQSPGARAGHMVIETAWGTLLWGGHDGTEYRNDMWRWTGSEWLLVDSGTPTPRTNYGAAYDSRRDRVVVFGGREDCASGSYLNETWEWDGDSWLQRFPTTSPSPRERSRLAYDSARSRVVLYGGFDGTNELSDTWEWDGDNWIQRSPTSVPGSSSGHAMSYDAGRKLSILFGTPGTWDYGSERPGETISTETVDTCLSILGTTPQLVPTEWNGPWVGDSIGLDFVDMPPSIPVMLFGFTPLPLPLNLFFLGQPLCELAVSPDIIEPLFPFVPPYESGPLPNDPALEGVSLYAQAAFLDLLGGPLVTSNSLQLTLGSK